MSGLGDGDGPRGGRDDVQGVVPGAERLADCPGVGTDRADWRIDALPGVIDDPKAEGIGTPVQRGQNGKTAGRVE